MHGFAVLLSLFPSLILSYRPASTPSVSILSPLYGSKHHARYGNFADSLPRTKSNKMKELETQLNIPKVEGDVTTGADLRRSRLRNLKEAQKAIPVIDYGSPEAKVRKWSDEEIERVIECLNLSYGKKKKSELSDEERVGVINWENFDLHASSLIPDYTALPRTRKNIISWILYHRKKMDIRYVEAKGGWVFDPKGSPKRLYKRLSKKKLEVFNR